MRFTTKAQVYLRRSNERWGCIAGTEVKLITLFTSVLDKDDWSAWSNRKMHVLYLSKIKLLSLSLSLCPYPAILLPGLHKLKSEAQNIIENSRF
jgi:hypothetical protein